MALEFRRARHLDVFIIAHDVHHGVRAGFLGALFEIHESGKKSDIARLHVVAAACTSFTVRLHAAQAGRDRRRRFFAEEKLHRAVRLLARFGGVQRRFDRQNVFVVARIGARGHQNGQDQRAGHGDGVRPG